MSALIFTARPRRRVRHLAIALAVVLGLVVAGVGPAAVATTGSVAGVAFHDDDRDGIHDAGEPPFAAHRIYLLDGSGAYLTNRTTDAEGGYVFEGLPAGAYRVTYASATWWELRDAWVPTTTGSLYPEVAIDVTGSTRVDFGWRPLVRSTDLAAPLSVHVGPEGVRVESFTDAVAATTIADALASGTLGAEASSVTVRFGWGSSSSTTSAIGATDGRYDRFRAISYVSYESWLDGGARTLSHEYGHAWAEYHAYLVQQDPTFAAYLEARGIADDPRVDTSYAWNVAELIAEDHRQLLGPPDGRGGQLNPDLPAAADVPGLEEFLRVTFTAATGAEPSPEPEPSPGSEPSPGPGSISDTTAPVVTIADPTDGQEVTGAIGVVAVASDDRSVRAELTVTVAVGGASQRAVFDEATGSFVAQVDTSGLAWGPHVVTVTAEDAAGNRDGDEVTIYVAKQKRSGGAGGCRGKRC